MNMPTVEERVRKLEQSMTRWRRAALGLGGVLVLVSTMAANQEEVIPDVIKARSIEVINEKGEAVVQMNSGNPWGGSLTIYNKAQKQIISANPSGLRVYNGDKEKEIFGVEVSSNTLNCGTKDGHAILQAGQREGGDGYIHILNNDGKNTMYGPSYR